MIDCKLCTNPEFIDHTCSFSFRKRLLALAAQKFVSDIAADAYQHARIRTNAAVSGRSRGPGGQSAKVRHPLVPLPHTYSTSA